MDIDRNSTWLHPSDENPMAFKKGTWNHISLQCHFLNTLGTTWKDYWIHCYGGRICCESEMLQTDLTTVYPVLLLGGRKQVYRKALPCNAESVWTDAPIHGINPVHQADGEGIQTWKKKKTIKKLIRYPNHAETECFFLRGKDSLVLFFPEDFGPVKIHQLHSLPNRIQHFQVPERRHIRMWPFR